jgi:antitoxin (DNA-binding transcriptional repressor) of toxin-antitoxin stability system
MIQVTVEQATEQLPGLIEAALRGEEIVIIKDNDPTVKLTPITPAEQTVQPQARFGSGKGLLLYMAPDFDAPLEDFREYME